MRSEQVMFALIDDIARRDERIRAVIMNGSRANPNAPRDLFQDFDIVFVVTDVASFTANHSWIDQFGERMILQMPDAMSEPPPGDDEPFAYLIQLADGNRIDLTLYPVAKLATMEEDTMSVLLLDKDSIIAPFPPTSDQGYYPTAPTAKQFFNCCNEFWWVSTYVAKGLWREEILYAKEMMEQIVRGELMKMLTWYLGIQTNFSKNLGKAGKYFQGYLEPDLWTKLETTFADADYAHTWDALEAMCDLFRTVAVVVAEHLGFAYLSEDDQRVSAHLRHVRALPKDAPTMY
ncbi:MAG TPA: aminoglycoside 6-adenylyltransferase [Caldilineaceae bacterium]|nr:aminoglycoside 6-adenylyltransferase [Caldilineaceae bacterium]